MVEVHAFSPNRGESFVLERAASGFRPGKDIAGIVTRPAASGRGPGRGDRVVAHLDHSGWAERAVVPIDRLAVIPEAIGDTQAAALPLAGLTATGRLHPEIGRVADWRDTPQIIEAIVARKVRGNAVLTIPSSQTDIADRQRRPLPERNPA